MKNSGNKTGKHARKSSGKHGNKYILAGKHHHDADSTAGTQGTVNSKVGDIQNSKGDVNADGGNSPDQTLSDSTRHCIQ